MYPPFGVCHTVRRTSWFVTNPGVHEQAGSRRERGRRCDRGAGGRSSGPNPWIEPLDRRGQTAVQLSVSGDETRVTVELDHDQAEHLVDAIATTD